MTGLKIRKMFVQPLHLCILMLKYGIMGAVITAEVDLIFRLTTIMGVDITVWIGFIVIVGLNIAVHFLLRRLPIKWERFEPKKN